MAKPVSQVDWDTQVRDAVAAIAANSVGEGKPDLRPRLFDRKSGLSVLLDTGASCSIWPKKYFKVSKPLSR